MSHVVSVDIHIKDLDALEAACKELGLELRRGQLTHKWYGRWVNDYNAQDAAYKQGIKPEDYGKCEHAIAVTGNSSAYEIGLVKRPDGKPGWTLIFDFWAGGGGLMAKVGENAKLLRQRYAVCVAEKQARRQGFRTVRKQIPGGKMQVIARK